MEEQAAITACSKKLDYEMSPASNGVVDMDLHRVGQEANELLLLKGHTQVVGCSVISTPLTLLRSSL